ncbi:Pao retrotransposon peptidase family protein-like protein [Aphelenchoides avenae]|nr:Pao retrotransposon peptidase family protein-like protein [Aphelenchus avenae]
MSTAASSVAARRGPSISSSGPLKVGADRKPLSKSNADTVPPTSARGDADFGPEDTCAFYRNANYHPSAIAGRNPLPSWTLSLKPALHRTIRRRHPGIIECQPGLDPRHKLQYLLQYLQGEPHRMASSYMLTDSNYTKVLELLEERYGDPTRLCGHLNQLLISLPAPAENATDLRRFHNDSTQLISELGQIGHDPSASTLVADTLL